MNLNLKVWRQKDVKSEGRLVDYEAKNIPPDASFLEMLDIVNEDLESKGEEPIAFDHDCREGICGTCSLSINGIPHGPSATTTCQLYMRKFRDGETIHIEPFRAGPFPVLRDLCTDRTSFDRIQQAGGFITAHVGSAPDGNALPIAKKKADESMEAAACIGCGACVAACPNSSAMLFVGAKVSHFANLPQGQPERDDRVLRMVRTMDEEGYGNCSNYLECEAVCPADIPASVITLLNRDFTIATIKEAIA
ncbi:MAG TPA: succinate dehydrogenase/fumarate reductase iron-sulfur subunit [Chthoniobacteraceae bacterium]|jgi:succinate dehydrogenase / fumarate reductase iron-sulfur subunit|nr:succinate dehydrogenase/fumarate reductase iron-sulfur subunit [Chthoniobacteraceae bacterium]